MLRDDEGHRAPYIFVSLATASVAAGLYRLEHNSSERYSQKPASISFSFFLIDNPSFFFPAEIL